MDLKDRQRVEVVFAGKARLGHVHESRGRRSVLLDEWKLVEPSDWSKVAPSPEPTIPGGPGQRTWERGDRVAFGLAGDIHNGTVTVADMLEASVLVDGGGSVGMSCRDLRPSPVPAPAVRTTVMRSWSIMSHRRVPGAEGAKRQGFVAEIGRNGVRAATAYNNGHRSSSIEGATPSVIMLQDMAAAWVLDSGAEHLDPSVYGGVDLWLDYEINQRPFGVDPQDWLLALDARVAEAHAAPKGP